MNILPDSMIINFAVLLVAFVILSKGADLLVDGAVGVAYKLLIPKVIIGIVLVGFGTTMPEFTVSVISAAQGHSEMALGNAVGSVIVNISAALGLGVLFAPKPLKLDPSVFRSVGIIFFAAGILTFILALNGEISRIEGAALLVCLAGYLTFIIVTEKRRKQREFEKEVIKGVEETAAEENVAEGKLIKFLLIFLAGLVVVVVASKFLVEAAINIADHFGVSETIIGLTIVAIGTSLPEIATCIVASRKGHSDLAFGDIMGANILNLLWIIGGASLARPIVVSLREIYFMFPFMLGIVAVLFILSRFNYTLNRWKSIILITLYIGYTIVTVFLFIPGAPA